ncbi:hypothetical protein [Amycolatopsis tolypomycina]|uniref:hypothetical protein n=1 Tax=Amycolatopsis tolypomycina TaxID=208445 RepID=UPI00142E88D4|nr:hypothetical protein [Amycolatopsis tolypomycina]
MAYDDVTGILGTEDIAVEQKMHEDPSRARRSEARTKRNGLAGASPGARRSSGAPS